MKWSLEEDWNIFHTPNTKDNTPSLHCNSNSTYSKQCWCLESAPLVREGVHPRAVAMTSITTRETPAMRIQRLKEEQRQKEKGTAPAPPRLETMQEFLPPPANLFAPPKEEENKVGSKRKAEEKKKTEKKSKKKEKAVKKKDKKKDKKDKKKKKDKKGKKKKKKSESSSSDSSDSSSSWRIYSMAEALEDRRRQSSAVKKLQMLRWLAIESGWRYRGWHPIIFRYRCSQRDLAKDAYEINFMMMMMMVVMMMMRKRKRRTTTLMMALLLRLALQSFHIAFDICGGFLSHDRKKAADWYSRTWTKIAHVMSMNNGCRHFFLMLGPAARARCSEGGVGTSGCVCVYTEPKLSKWCNAWPSGGVQVEAACCSRWTRPVVSICGTCHRHP